MIGKYVFSVGILHHLSEPARLEFKSIYVTEECENTWETREVIEVAYP